MIVMRNSRNVFTTASAPRPDTIAYLACVQIQAYLETSTPIPAAPREYKYQSADPCMAMQVLAGHPQYVFYTGVAAALYSGLCACQAARRRSLRGLHNSPSRPTRSSTAC